MTQVSIQASPSQNERHDPVKAFLRSSNPVKLKIPPWWSLKDFAPFILFGRFLTFNHPRSGRRFLSALFFTVLFVAAYACTALIYSSFNWPQELLRNIGFALPPKPDEKQDSIWSLFTWTVTFLLLTYWNLDNLFSKKRHYAANLFNELLKIRAKKEAVSKTREWALEVALAIDILHLDLWGTRSFFDFFKDQVVRAIDDSPEILDANRDSLREQFMRDDLSQKDVDEILSPLLSNLQDQIDNEPPEKHESQTIPTPTKDGAAA